MTTTPAVTRLSRDMRKAAESISRAEARWLVDAYYRVQKDRIQNINHATALAKDGEPNTLIGWLGEQNWVLETQIKGALDRFSLAHPVGRWSRSIIGIGPVIAAGLLAHIDITRARTAGQIWRFAGLDPTVKWNRGQKRPWNARLKVLCWHIGESFARTKGHEDSTYGPLYELRKQTETDKNEAGVFEAQAVEGLKRIKDKKSATAKAYAAGKLPAGRIDLRAKRYAVKLFLSHWHEVAWRAEYGEAPPVPFAVAHMGHAHVIRPPNLNGFA